MKKTKIDFNKLCLSKQPSKRQIAASHAACPYNIIQKLSDDPNSYVRALVAKNPNVTVDILEKLSKDKEERVVAAVAENKKSTKDILENIFNNYGKNKYILMCLARNIFIPEEIIFKIIKSYAINNRYVASEIIKRSNVKPKMLDMLAESKHSRIRYHVAKCKKSSPKTLAKLADDKDLSIRIMVADNTKTPVKSLAKLSNDKFSWVRLCVARNKNITKDILSALSVDNELQIRKSTL